MSSSRATYGTDHVVPPVYDDTGDVSDFGQLVLRSEVSVRHEAFVDHIMRFEAGQG